MPIFTNTIPLSMYIHIPWCVRKCPYCDFNSHQLRDGLPEAEYVAALLSELDQHLPKLAGRELTSIFFGGGTPSLFSGYAIEKILEGVAKRIPLNPHVEITLEANPGTIDYVRFSDFHRAGINRLSVGVQSMQDEQLRLLGRIHNRDNVLRAVDTVRRAGFNNFNLDIMYGLPKQTIETALSDVETALSLEPTHFSWYQLTIEPNTAFYHKPPTLPADDKIWEMQQAGLAIIQDQGFTQYEVSAYAQRHKKCKHNVNYWQFGDYIGIGAGAHSKITNHETGVIERLEQIKLPRQYLDAKQHQYAWSTVPQKELAFEFMLNALRLTAGVPKSLFTERTGLPLSVVEDRLEKAVTDGLLEPGEVLMPTAHGKRYLNNLVELFL